MEKIVYYKINVDFAKLNTTKVGRVNGLCYSYMQDAINRVEEAWKLCDISNYILIDEIKHKIFDGTHFVHKVVLKSKSGDLHYYTFSVIKCYLFIH